ncbi:chemotaxis protein CheW [Sulfurospirillum arcachonense]|uniref:chemotaxis protein CheW n=1 Tax=Sulfurospirillum arcachonense TaxID=57666 RepID=UPI0004695450|nr:chemotaxis protein CheW [Sulfurospirillum arcachonense]
MNEEGKRELNQDSSRFLTFFIDDEQYGLNISHVKEIIASMNITNVPKTPDYIKGVINLRGAVIPIVDVRLKFGMDERAYDINTAIIINEIDNVSIGFIVDRVEDVLSIKHSELTEPPKFGTNVDTSFIESVAQINENVVMVLNLKKIFEQSELVDISNIEKSENDN